MKILCTLALSLFSAVTLANEITSDEFYKILEMNKTEYERVLPGMNATYLETVNHHENGSVLKCQSLIELTVKSVPDSDSVYKVEEKTTRLSNCGSLFRDYESTSEVVDYHLTTIEELKDHFKRSEFEFKSISQWDNQINIYGLIDDGPKLKSEYRELMELGKSQFFDVVIGRLDDYSIILIKRDEIGH
jgi:hypothetical protein